MNSGTEYHEGDIRLVGGSYSWEGRVEIFLHREWGAITETYYIHNYLPRDSAPQASLLGVQATPFARSAHVVCRQLGYDTRCEDIRVLFM